MNAEKALHTYSKLLSGRTSWKSAVCFQNFNARWREQDEMRIANEWGSSVKNENAVAWNTCVGMLHYRSWNWPSLCVEHKRIRKSRTVRFKNLLFAVAALLLVHQSAMWKKIDQGQAPTMSELQLENPPHTVCNHSWWPATTTCGRTTGGVLMLATHVVVHASHVWNERKVLNNPSRLQRLHREKLATPSIEYNEMSQSLRWKWLCVRQPLSKSSDHECFS